MYIQAKQISNLSTNLIEEGRLHCASDLDSKIYIKSDVIDKAFNFKYQAPSLHSKKERDRLF